MNLQKGFTLLEVLVSMMLLGLALFAFNGAQIMVLNKQRQAMYFYIAHQQLYAFSSLYSVSLKPLSEDIIAQWQTQVRQALPKGVGVVEYQDKQQQVKVLWGDRDTNECTYNTLGLNGCIRQALSLNTKV